MFEGWEEGILMELFVLWCVGRENGVDFVVVVDSDGSFISLCMSNIVRCVVVVIEED